MKKWLERSAAVLELTAVGVLLLIVLGLVVGALTAFTARSGQGIANLSTMVLVVLWLGRFSVFGYLGARAAGRAGEWWLAVPGGLLAHLSAAIMGWASIRVQHPDPASLGITGNPLSLVMQESWVGQAAVVGVVVVASALGPRLRNVERREPSRFMTGLGALLVAGVVGAFAVWALDGLRARTPPPTRSAASLDPASLVEMRGLLEELAESQRVHRSSGAPSFARSAAILGMEPADGFELEVLGSGPDGWAARSYRTGDPGAGCATWHGRVPRPPTTPGGLPVPEGRIVCDR